MNCDISQFMLAKELAGHPCADQFDALFMITYAGFMIHIKVCKDRTDMTTGHTLGENKIKMYFL